MSGIFGGALFARCHCPYSIHTRAAEESTIDRDSTATTRVYVDDDKVLRGKFQPHFIPIFCFRMAHTEFRSFCSHRAEVPETFFFTSLGNNRNIVKFFPLFMICFFFCFPYAFSCHFFFHYILFLSLFVLQKKQKFQESISGYDKYDENHLPLRPEWWATRIKWELNFNWKRITLTLLVIDQCLKQKR